MATKNLINRPKPEIHPKQKFFSSSDIFFKVYLELFWVFFCFFNLLLLLLLLLLGWADIGPTNRAISGPTQTWGAIIPPPTPCMQNDNSFCMQDGGSERRSRRRSEERLPGVESCWWPGRGACGEDGGQADDGSLQEEEWEVHKGERERERWRTHHVR